ncbi:MAG: GNAT family N-acetyltransferase [Arenicellales bacterium]|nr:GNAT family N-acetyltransferase [Arenicellales bacterium]MDP6314183.1 GNAT family N-acetyltransferase [Arenicellales bacterium]MDP7192800.1 GNAT family N-acetyltransferase [Arenicellales bacterium]MDP7489599.1 GNAT family N-acetyltransferase [Arenicellales bacterium]MDP7568651.1 GNAT family N-acetyltransferase [Arenicellales bacterium]
MELQLITKRLTLRPLSINDVGLAIEMFTDEQVMKYAGGTVAKEKIIEEMEMWTHRGGNGCIGVWCICDRTTGESFGSTALTPLPIDKDDTDWEQVVEDQLPDGEMEIGYFLKRTAWGNGYATEAVERILRFAFEDSPLEEVVAVIDPKNESSRRVLEKTGFLSTGIRRAYGEDLPGFQIIRENWLGRQ